jgi:hypothetical protein
MADMERTIMRGKLAQAKEDKGKLVLKISGLCAGIRQALNPLITPVEEMDIAQAATQMDELVTAHVEMLGLTTDIQRLERAING